VYPPGDLSGFGEAMIRMDVVLAQMREEMKGRGTERLSYDRDEAARLLGMSNVALEEMIRSCVVLTIQLDSEQRIPASEIRRLKKAWAK
jgi:hypothetical protein